MARLSNSTTDLKLARLPPPSPLPVAALPSVSRGPRAPLTDDTDYRMIHEELSGEIIGAAMAVGTTRTGEALGRHITVFVMSSGVETSLDSGC